MRKRNYKKTRYGDEQLDRKKLIVPKGRNNVYLTITRSTWQWYAEVQSEFIISYCISYTEQYKGTIKEIKCNDEEESYKYFDSITHYGLEDFINETRKN